MLSDDDIAALVRDFYSTIIAKDDDERLSSAEPDRWREHRVALYQAIAEKARLDLGSNAFGSVRTITSVMLARRFGRDASLDERSIRQASHAMLRAGVDVAEALRARAEGDFNYEPKDKLLIKALIEQSTSAANIESEPAAMTRTEARAGEPLSKEAEEFRETQLRRKVWENQTALQARKTYSLFLDCFGDRPPLGFTRRDAAKFKDLLSDLPAMYGKAAAYRGMTAGEIVQHTKGLDVERLSPRTIQRHFAALATLWDSLIEKGRASDNIFQGWKFPATKRAQDQRAHWTRDELAALLATPLWAGCQSPHRRSKPGALIIRDEKFWLPLIALFSGMRQEEICQLRLTDVRQEEGTWVFDLNTRDGQQLKNANARRLVPIHHELIRIGILEYLEEQSCQGRRLLFPNLRPGGADDRLGHNYSKWFSRYRKEVGLFVEGRDFHSFRHSATTFMRRAGIDKATVDEVTGHASVGETARYTKGLSISNLSSAINAISINVDLTALYKTALES